MPDFYNEPWQTHLRIHLRKNPTIAEAALWERLSNRQLGVKFRRQHGFDRYIVDFYCWEAKLIIEVDGGIHDLSEVRENDRLKEECLRMHGLDVIRFTNEQVLGTIEEVIAVIRQKISPFKGIKGSPRSKRREGDPLPP